MNRKSVIATIKSECGSQLKFGITQHGESVNYIDIFILHSQG